MLFSFLCRYGYEVFNGWFGLVAGARTIFQVIEWLAGKPFVPHFGFRAKSALVIVCVVIAQMIYAKKLEDRINLITNVSYNAEACRRLKDAIDEGVVLKVRIAEIVKMPAQGELSFLRPGVHGAADDWARWSRQHRARLKAIKAEWDAQLWTPEFENQFEAGAFVADSNSTGFGQPQFLMAANHILPEQLSLLHSFSEEAKCN